MPSKEFVIRFWGVRGSYPVPGPHTIRYGGNTTCIEVQLGPHTLILDAGTGIVNLGRDLVRRARQNGGAPITVTLLLTHMHHDHTQGFPFFLPAHVGSSTLNIMGPRTFDEDLEDALTHAVLPPNFPVSLHEMPSLKTVRSLKETDSIVIDPQNGGIRVHNIHHSPASYSTEMIHISIHRSRAHPKEGVYFYRIEWQEKSLVLATDTEGYLGTDQRLVDFARNANVLIHDAQYTQEEYIAAKQGWGHSTPEMACAVARQAGVDQLVLVHHEPTYDDDKIAAMECAAQRHFENTIAGYEGLEIVL